MSTPSTQFMFGTLTLPEDVEKFAKSLCETQKLTPTQLFCKWEALALKQSSTSDVPTVAELEQIASSIRDKQQHTPSKTGGHTPRSASKRRSAGVSPLYKAPVAPLPINIDDFFNYVPGGGSTNVEDAGTGSGDTVKQESEHAGDMAGGGGLGGGGDYDDGDDVNGNVIAAKIEKKDEEGAVIEGKYKIIRNRTDRISGSTNGGDGEKDDLKLPSDDIPDEAYARRAGSGRVEATHGVSDETSPPTRSKGMVTCKIVQRVPRDAQYMNDEISSRADAFRQRVKRMGSSILEGVVKTRGLDEVPELPAHAFLVASPDVTWAAGRIRVDLDDSDGVGAGRINKESVMLESVDGGVVKLDLSRLLAEKRPVFLAPGTVVVVEGVNINGRCIDVHALHDNCVEVLRDADDKRKIKVEIGDGNEVGKEEGKGKENVGGNGDELEKKDDAMGKSEESNVKIEIKLENEIGQVDKVDKTAMLRVLTAAGPFTTAANLQYEPLDDFLDIVRHERPDIAVLTGPFVDSRHQLVNASLPASFDTVFETRVLDKIVRCAQSIGTTQFIMVPSLDDVHHAFVAPQPAFDVDDHVMVVQASNPCVLELNCGQYVTRVAVSSLPGITDLASDCICWNVDRFQAISTHFVRQQSMYPVAPPSKAVPIDSSHMHSLRLPAFKDAPSVDLLINPSRIKAFVRCVDEDVVVVNPGLLCRGSGGGTYGEIQMPLHVRDAWRKVALNEQRSHVNVIRL